MSLHEQHDVTTDTEADIQSKVKNALNGTPFAVSTLTKLTGGTANFMYHATLENHSKDYPDGVVVKQGEAYVALHPSFKIATSRCVSVPSFCNTGTLIHRLTFSAGRRTRVSHPSQRILSSNNAILLDIYSSSVSL